MNLKKNWKRFWTLSQSREGFTLVELIVVIAIMAILAGVAVPAYSGYIKKANKAADLQLLGAINTAFGAACIENGDAPADLADGSVSVTWTDKKVTGVSGKYNEAFTRYYGANASSEFKVITALYLKDGVFTEDEVVTYTYGGTTVTVSQGTGALLSASTFGTEMGAQGMLDKVNDVTNFAQAMLDGEDANAFTDALGGMAFNQQLAGYLGIEGAESMDETALKQAIDVKVMEMSSEGKDVSNILSNSAVLYAAQNAASQNPDDVMALLTSGNAKQQIASNTNSGDMLSQAALAYGMYTAYAYANDPGDNSLISKTNDPVDILNGLEDEGFQAYLQTEQANTDLQAYMATLNTVGNAANDSTAAQEVLVNGFNDPDLVAILNQAMGTQN